MAGDAAELERLYLEAGPRVWRYLRRCLGQPADADELLQDVFCILAKDAGALAAVLRRPGWLIGIARNLVRSHLRRMRIRRGRPMPDDVPAPCREQEDEGLEGMRSAIARLPEPQREVLEMRLAHEMSYQEIADALDIPLGTVRSRLHHATRALTHWAERHGTGALAGG